MATHALAENPRNRKPWTLAPVGMFPGMRPLAWDGKTLYASQRYEIWRASIDVSVPVEWKFVSRFQLALWRNFTSRSRLGSRLVRDGFHALALLPSGHKVAAVPGAIVTMHPNDDEFRVSHRILRGTRPLHITATPDGKIYWGEYFDNQNRDEVHIYGSGDYGATWNVAYTFPKRSIRHVHNLVYDDWRKCVWIFTGDDGEECRILRASTDLRAVETVLSGSQQARAAAAIPSRDGLYFSSDTPFERNHIYFLDRAGRVHELAEVNGSSIYGCRVGDAMFFSTMIEPGNVNTGGRVCVYGSLDGTEWRELLHWKKDGWPSKLFQFGNALLPDGRNGTSILALSTVATQESDLQMSLWQV